MRLSSPSGLRSNDSKRRIGLLATLHLDLPLLVGILLLGGFGLIVLFSAAGQDIGKIERQLVRLAVAFVLMFIVAQIPPPMFKRWSPAFYIAGVLMLVAVLLFGDIGKGAQRWLDLGFMRFQPSELLKLSVPMMIAWYLSDRTLPPSWKHLFIASIMIIVPVLMIAKQPDLGTSLLVASTGIFVLFLAGISWKLITGFVAVLASITPLVWMFLMRPYQKQRVLTMLDPESDPLGSGYHIIQSKIAIGSGGMYGKGWMNGTQSHLDFLPERTTDFIFAVIGEEFGLAGIIALMTLYLYVIIRGLYIATQAQDTFGRLLAGSLTLVLFVYLFVNTGMVTGLLPVVGVPLPLISYGGTSLVTLMISFGILMSIHTHRKLLTH